MNNSESQIRTPHYTFRFPNYPHLQLDNAVICYRKVTLTWIVVQRVMFFSYLLWWVTIGSEWVIICQMDVHLEEDLVWCGDQSQRSIGAVCPISASVQPLPLSLSRHLSQSSSKSFLLTLNSNVCVLGIRLWGAWFQHSMLTLFV